MKILIVSLFLPQRRAGHAGGRFVFEAVKELSRKHDIYLATRVEEKQHADLDELKPFCKEIYPYFYRDAGEKSVFDIFRLLGNYLGFSRSADRLISRGKFDAVQVEWVEAAALIRKKSSLMILDAQDVITKPAERRYRQSTGYSRFFRYIIYRFTRYVETTIVGRFQFITTRSASDRDYLLGMDPGLKVTIVPHPAGLDFTERIFPRRRHTLLFLASYKHRKSNVDIALHFYRNIFPLIRSEFPDATFIIAGYGPPQELLSLPEHDSNVVVTGFVERVEECYKQAEVFVAPILVGGGIIAKILDAMIAGTPVVTSIFGNEGIGAEPGKDIEVADTPESFAAAVIRILRDGAYANRLAENGREFVQKRFTREAVLSRLESLYQQVRR